MSHTHKNYLVIILILGALETISPFAIDMYLPAFTQLAQEFHSSVAQISLSVSSYFIGLALGQIFYGPLLDRFGRKRPVYAGLLIFIIASIGCMTAPTIEALIVWRFFQALGGCSASVAAMAMVRDLFPVEDGAKIFSLLILILGVSPLLAPTFGGFITTTFGWHAVFAMLAAITAAILLVAYLYLPSGHMPDKNVSLHPGPIARGFWDILKHPQFYTYAVSSAFSFAGIFVYVAGSPVIFMEVFHLDPQIYGGVFALLSIGFIGSSQVNVILIRYFNSDIIYRAGIVCQTALGIIFVIGIWCDWYGLYATIGLLFLILCCIGITIPNATALAMAPFSEEAGRAAAMLGFLQMGVGALASTGVGLLNSHRALPAIAVLAATSLIGLAIYLLGKRNISELTETTAGAPAVAH